MERLKTRMAQIAAEEVPALVIGDYNVIPRDNDIWSTRAMADDALMQPESRAAYRRLLHAGWTDALGCSTRVAESTRSGTIRRAPGSATMVFASIMRCFRPNLPTDSSQPGSTKPIAGGKRPATTPRSGSRSPSTRDPTAIEGYANHLKLA
jgi:hypothetical protein